MKFLAYKKNLKNATYMGVNKIFTYSEGCIWNCPKSFLFKQVHM